MNKNLALLTLSAVTLLAIYATTVHAEPGFNARGVAAGQRTLVSDGQGNVSATGGSGLTTASGGQGLRTGRFERSADGTASAGRSTSMTNANTGVSLDASTTYTKGSGVSRSASCKDAAGNSVACVSR